VVVQQGIVYVCVCIKFKMQTGQTIVVDGFPEIHSILLIGTVQYIHLSVVDSYLLWIFFEIPKNLPNEHFASLMTSTKIESTYRYTYTACPPVRDEFHVRG
jgi:hypothetical protein